MTKSISEEVLPSALATMKLQPENEMFALDSDSDFAEDEVRPLFGAHPTSSSRCRPPSRNSAIALVVLFLSSLVILLVTTAHEIPNIDDTKISHYWGQYSPFFSLEDQSEINPAIPPECNITFVQVLARHGARFPTAHKSAMYTKLVDRIQQTATEYKTDVYALLKDYRYKLGADDLTSFGEQQMINMGTSLYDRYEQLARQNVPFVRASGSDRVIASGALFSKGFNDAKAFDPYSDKSQHNTTVSLVIPEGRQWNNTLDTGTCDAFSDGSPAHKVQQEFLGIFAPSILERLVANMPGVNLELHDIPLLMDLCPFETVNSKNGTMSPLCDLFTLSEWQSYDYYNTLEKYYAFGAGNPLGSTRGVGYVNEIISRMTKTLPVSDHTSVNHTLDSDPTTFPLDTALYADFSHDNAMVSIFDAFGLYNSTVPLSARNVQSATETEGYAASWIVPFASRAFFEVMECSSYNLAGEERLVRVLVNDRVVPLHGCDIDSLGRCRLNDWVNGLDFARNGGRWDDYCSKPKNG
ncbi:phytase [Talaromyces stipitatus ATCC 10500]|uniref:Phytase A n=1 Tax=Talaromyces stipitatus (strain ATCC 10500 / CBS 375.48 / QM 6759 / NRRL 1006) TaxID=441959 RepID=B8MHX6_TALSN|nr:phytase [Talaromyces stipitatus ATCC 10500]EED16457.1 phytase [Talaromyces stipitatus ATCC 10500]